jgi:predicted RNase H-like HicB family nuclease
MNQLRLVLVGNEEGYSVACPDLPGCWSQGDTVDEAMLNIQDAIRVYLEVDRDLATG